MRDMARCPTQVDMFGQIRMLGLEIRGTPRRPVPIQSPTFIRLITLVPSCSLLYVLLQIQIHCPAHLLPPYSFRSSSCHRPAHVYSYTSHVFPLHGRFHRWYVFSRLGHHTLTCSRPGRYRTLCPGELRRPIILYLSSLAGRQAQRSGYSSA